MAEKMNLNLGEDLGAWVAYVSGVKGKSKTAYINDLIREDMERATGKLRDGYLAFVEARGGE